jgi:mannitol-1-/sugar-/sorbitol-6-/2-deoxyglucose-6-phosphatase
VIAGVLFDMDGLLIDSEPLWQRAEMEVFGSVGLALTRTQCLATRGLRVDEAVAYWFARSPWRGPTEGAVRDAIVARVTALVCAEGRAKPGVGHAIEFFRVRGLPLGVASSSDYAIIEAVLDRLGIRSAFATIHSGEEELRGKPDPAIYRRAASKLGVAADRCVALEDSPSGVASAKAAGMRCIAVIDAEGVGAHDLEAERERLGAADVVLRSLAEIDARVWEGVARG